MKRKDWKIKKLKKDIYGKGRFYKRRRLIFLRTLYLRRVRSLFKKNLILNFFFFKKLINSFSTIKKSHVNNIYYYNNKFNKFIYFYPTFFFKKKLFYLENNFKDFIINNNLNFIFIKNKIDKINPDSYNFNGANLVIFNKFNENFKVLNTEEQELYKNSFIIKINNFNAKSHFDECIHSEINWFLNYNVYFMNIVEIYKILILINLYNVYSLNNNF